VQFALLVRDALGRALVLPVVRGEEVKANREVRVLIEGSAGAVLVPLVRQERVLLALA